MLAELRNCGGKYLTNTSTIGYFGRGETGRHKYLVVQQTVEGYKLLEISTDYILVTSGGS